ncbi:Arylsulfatase [hydrothermal vent metagenome]|uniref:Arylsulfatase n=1 Tax=hydrothermal vent metagenome TaxID=652676 RepID=A0A3B1D5R0_9ZZZZ
MIKNFTKIMGILILPFIMMLSGCSIGDKTTDEKPNIIFILTDDQRWDAMGSNNAEILTPEMDKLAKDGVKFTNAFVTTPICAVSRASILSGEYALRNGIKDFKTHFSDSAYAFTYPMQLKQAGYRIGFIGKYGVGREEDFPKDKYDYWGCFPGQGTYWHKDSLGNAVHLTKILGNRALSFIKESPKDKPFCLSISFKAPHAQDRREIEFLFDSTYIDLYKDKVFPTPETGADIYWKSFPEWFRKNNEARIRWKKRFSTPEKYQRTLHGYYRLIYGADIQIGRIRKLLKETGRDKNTIIMFMGDNGFYLAEHGMAGKWYAHEESIRVPLIIYDPRVEEIQKGLVNDKMALNIDIAPTILDYAGFEIPKTMQGKSLRNILYNNKSSWRNEFFFEHPFKYKRIPRSEGIVTKDWKYIRFIDRKPGAEWLYNTGNDPKEKVNLAEDKKYSEIKAQLKKRFEKLKEKVR